MNKDVEKLKEIAKGFGPISIKLANDVLDDPRFAKWPGSINKHHNFKGGLAKHTREVYEIAYDTVVRLRLYNASQTALFFACLYHDVGKFYDYKPAKHGKWVKTKHARLVHHITRSGLIWSHDIARYPELDILYHDSVLHAILAHHGRREWGSPVAPKSDIAWLLHCSDTLSARMNDWDKIDIIDEIQK